MTGVVKKMHGLQVYQDVETSDTLSNGTSVADNRNVEALAWTITRPDNLIVNGIVQAGTDRQTYLKRATLEVWYKNVSAFPVRFVSVLARARRDITIGTANVFVLMEDGAPPFAPYLSYTTSNTFQKLFKIIKTKDRLIPGGACKKIVMKDKQYLSRAINGDVEGDNTNYTYRKGNQLWIHMFHGTPVLLPDSDNDPATCCSRFQILVTRRFYYSWYRMDIPTPQSTGSVLLPLPVNYTTLSAQNTKNVCASYSATGYCDPTTASTNNAWVTHGV